MDALFGEIDHVEAREAEDSTAYTSATELEPREKEKTMMLHIDVVAGEKKSFEKV